MIKVTVEVPATTANLGPGFDSLGLALDLWNRFELEVVEDETTAHPGAGRVDVSCEGEGADELPHNEENLVYQAFLRGFEGERGPAGIRLRINNQVPLSSGLGSSATAIVGGLLAANTLREKSLSQAQLVNLATRMEGHPDNVAPALLGGLVASVMKRDGTVEAISVKPPAELWVAVSVPDFYLTTRITRAKLPERVSRDDAIFSLSRAALWVAAAATGNLTALKVATEDVLHQPHRSELIPGLDDVFEAANKAGALGVALSGSGPSVAGFCYQNEVTGVGEAMQQAFGAVGVTARVFTTRPAAQGARVEKVGVSRSRR